MDIQEVKKTLKKWERTFYQTHERKPDRKDIENAPQRIQDAYQSYQTLRKSSATPSSHRERASETRSPDGNKMTPPRSQDASGQTEGSADFWGDHLNKSASSEDDKEKDKQKEKESALESISQRMRKNMAGFKTPTSSKKESKSQFQKSKTPTTKMTTPLRLTTDENALKTSDTVSARNIFNVTYIKVRSTTKPRKPNHVDVFQMGKQKPRRRTLGADWLKECAHDIEDLKPSESVSLVDKNKNNLEVFSKNVEGHQLQNSLSEIGHTNKSRTAPNVTSCKISEDEISKKSVKSDKILESGDHKDDKFVDLSNKSNIDKTSTSRSTFAFGGDSKASLNRKISSEPSGKQLLDEKCDESTDGGIPPFRDESNFGSGDKLDNFDERDFASNAFDESVFIEENHPWVDVDESQSRKSGNTVFDDEGSEKENCLKRKRLSPAKNISGLKLQRDKRGSTGISLLDLNDEFEFEEEIALGEDHRDGGGDGLKENGEEDSDGEVEHKPKRRKTHGCSSSTSERSSKALNQNFVRLNMKRKTYARKGARMKGEAYKRMMWKQRNRGGGGGWRGGGRGGGGRFQNRGTDKCFKCGQEGHWASQCTGGFKKKTVEVDETPPEDMVAFPTLEETAMKAAGIQPDSDAAASFNMDSIRPPVYEESLPPPAMEPIYQPGPDGKPIDPPGEVYMALEKLGFTSFRAGQQQAVMNILSGLSTLLILSTGSGKSLCYQLPAYMYAQRSRCISLVISPLVSLMEDQIEGLPKALRGARLHSHLTKTQKEKVITELAENRVDVLLISPEALVSGGIGYSLNSSKMPPVAFACIDEAHCLSEWSHNFRPSYLMLCKVLREQFGVRCILGLTATATKSTARDVVEHFDIGGIPGSVVRGPSMPSNLVLCISRDVNKDRALVDLLQSDTFADLDSIIVYCIRREQTEKVASLIRTCLQDLTLKPTEAYDENGKPKKAKRKKKRKKGEKSEERPATNSAEAYHAGMSAAARRRVQNAFMADNLRIVVATVAFGMGLDKQDVRGVIHYCLPKSFESYVQEVGRSGRDGKKSVCHLFLDSKGDDLCELRKHVYSNAVDRYTVKKLVRRIFIPCKCLKIREMEDGTTAPREGEMRVCPGHEHTISVEGTVNDLDIKEEGIETLLCYLELHPKRWIRVLPNTWSTCTIHCYGGPKQLRDIAQKSPVVAAAIAKERLAGKSMDGVSSVTFEVVEVASSMGWNLSPVRRELKQLQWKHELGKGWQKTGVMVEFSELGYHFISPGDLSDQEMDEVITFLADRVEGQVKRELCQLKTIFSAMHSLSEEMAIDCDARETSRANLELKNILKEYFENSERVKPEELQYPVWEDLSLERMTCSDAAIRGDIKNFISIHHDRDFTGRAIARILQGIGSPVYPAQVWGKDRRFWRNHLNADFMKLVALANEELLRMR